MKVYVDAKILNMHDKTLPHEAFVGYVVDEGGQSNAKRVEADESDDAEILAVLFAVEELGKGGGPLTVVCDHESVVSEAKRPDVKSPSPLLQELRRVLREKPGVELVALLANPAHKVVTDYVNSVKGSTELG